MSAAPAKGTGLESNIGMTLFLGKADEHGCGPLGTNATPRSSGHLGSWSQRGETAGAFSLRCYPTRQPMLPRRHTAPCHYINAAQKSILIRVRAENFLVLGLH